MSEGGGTVIERLRVVIDATIEPYKQRMRDIRNETKEATKGIDRETAKIKRALNKIKEVRQQAFQTKDSSTGNHTIPEPNQEEQKLSRIRAINQQIRDMTKQANLQAGTTVQTNGYAQLQKDIQKTETSLDSLRRKQEAMKQSGVYEQAKEYSELSACITKAENKLNGLLAKEEMMKQQGVKTNSTGWKNLQYNIEETKNALNAYKQDIAGLEADGNSAVLAKEWDKTQLAIQKAEAELARYKQQKMMMATNGEDVEYKNPSRWSNGSQIESGVNMARMGMNQLNSSVERVKGNIKNFLLSIPGIGGAIRNTAYVGSKAFEGMKKVLKSTGNAIKKVSGLFGALLQKFKNGHPHLGKTKDSMGGLNNSANILSKGIFRLGNMFKLMLIRMAMRAVIEGVREGFQNLAQYSNQTNQSLSMLMSSMTQLKNSFATAFAPLLSVVAPILDAFIQKVISALTAIGQFFAALTGQKTFTIAKKVHQDYAASLNKTGDAAKKNAKKAKEAEGELMGFDRINNMSKNKGNEDGAGGGGGGAGGLSPGDMFDTVEIDSKYKDLANKVKGYFQQIFEPMKKAWDTYGQSVMNAWNRALKSVWELIKSIGKSFLEVWTNGTGEEFCGNILKGLRLILNMIGDIAIAFKNAWDDKGRGTKFIQSIFDLLNSVMDLLLEIGESMRIVWNSGSGESIIANLLDGFRHINNTLKNISDNFKKAWKLDNTGTKILQDLTDIFDNLLMYIKNITKNLEKWSKDLDFSPLLKSFQGITEALKPLGDKVGAGLEWLFEKVLQPLAKWAIEQAIPVTFDAIKEALRLLDIVLEKLKPFGKWLWEEFLKPLGQWTGDVIIKGIKGIGKVFKDLGDIIEDATDWKEALVNIGKYLIDGLKKGIKLALNAIGSWIKKHITDPIVKWVKSLFGIHSPSTVFKEIGGFLIDGLKKGVTNGAKNIATWIKTNVIDKITGAFKGFINNFVPKGKEIIQGIQDGWKNKKDEFMGWLGKKGSEISKGIGNIKDNFLGKGKNILDGIKDGWGEGWNEFKTWLAKIPSKIASAIGSLKSIGKSIMDSFVNGIKSVHVPTPHFKADSTFTIKGIDTHIPKVSVEWKANGGFVGDGQMFIAREAGPELVGSIGGRTAVANNDQIVMSVAQGVASAVNAVLVPAIQNGQHVNVMLYGDAKNLFKVMQQENRSCKMRTGRYGFST